LNCFSKGTFTMCEVGSVICNGTHQYLFAASAYFFEAHLC
jgi:hypothetical protein